MTTRSNFRIILEFTFNRFLGKIEPLTEINSFIFQFCFLLLFKKQACIISKLHLGDPSKFQEKWRWDFIPSTTFSVTIVTIRNTSKRLTKFLSIKNLECDNEPSCYLLFPTIYIETSTLYSLCQRYVTALIELKRLLY